MIAVLAMKPRTAIVAATLLHRRMVKCQDGFLGWGRECNVESVAGDGYLLAQSDREFIAASGGSISGRYRVRPNANVMEGREDRIVELDRTCKIGGGQREMVEHDGERMTGPKGVFGFHAMFPLPLSPAIYFTNPCICLLSG